MDRRAGALKGSESMPGTSLGGDPLAVAAIVAAMLPALVGAALLLFGVQDPYGRVPPLIWVIPAAGPFIAAFLGHRARRRARMTGTSAVAATIALILGYLGIAIYVVVACFFYYVYAFVDPWTNP